MPLSPFRLPNLIRSFAVAATIFSCLPGALAQTDPCTNAPHVPCGKARGLVAGHRARVFAEDMEPHGGQREEMHETDVLHYDLDIEISNLNTSADTCTIAGSNQIHVRSLAAGLTQFTFRLRNQYNITSATVNDITNAITVPVTISTPSTTTRVATLNRAYAEDEEFILTINYNGTSASRGFGSIDVATQNGTPVVATLSEAYFAYTWWPAKDGDFGEPGDNSDKATLDFTITVPNNYVVPSNGVLLSTETLSGNRKKYHWHTDYPIATYLVSFAATNYTKWTQTYTYPGGTMPVEFYIYPANDNGGNRAAWENVLNMLTTFRGVYGEYPFINEKYGHYNFNFGGGMEHQTMTGLGTFDEGVIAHELGHQWWGDMVTCGNWSDIWLNEGFATYSECLWEERKTGTPNATAYFNAIQAHKPFDFAGTVYVDAGDTADMNRIFDYNFTYLKGCWAVHQLRGVLGDSAFFQMLANYRAAHEFGTATTDDLQIVAQETHGDDLSWFFNQWVYGIGAPTYQYGWQSTTVNGQNYLLVRIAQTHTNAGYPNVFIMPVDLRVTIGGVPQTVTVFNNARTQWFVVPVSGPVTAQAFDPDQWILRNSATSVSYVAGPPKIIQTVPAPGTDTLTAPGINQLTIWFHANVNASAAHFSIVGANTGAQSFTLASGSNVNPVILNLTAPLPADTYTLTITSGVTAAVGGQALDGEIADPVSPASLPSGNGVAGGNAVINFTVSSCNFSGDIDDDCDKDDIDIDLFTQVLLEIDTIPSHMTRSDMNASGTRDGRDIQLFIDAQLAP